MRGDLSMKFVAVAATLAALASPAGAYDGQFVQKTCLSGDPSSEAMCVGYATGLAQSLMLANKFENPMGNFCEGDFQPSDAAEVVLEYLDLHPDMQTEDGAALMMRAMLDRFPCA